MLLGIFGDGKEYAKTKKFNVDGYECICLDEILMNPPRVLHKLAVYMKSHPQIKFFATGDSY